MSDLLLEGGLAGHMSHLYENPDLTFSEMKEIFIAASQGELEGTEKTDGQNLFISYSVKDSAARAVRNKTEILGGGLDAAGLAAKFADRGNLEIAFNEAFDSFEKTAQMFSNENQVAIFGEDANIFYNAEIQDPRNANVINYDFKTLNIHRVGHVYLDKKAGEYGYTPEIKEIDLSKNAQALENALQSIQNLEQNQNFKVQINAITKLAALSDDKILNNTLSELEKVISDAGISDNQTVSEYLIARIKPMIRFQMELPEETEKLLLKRIFGVKNEITGKNYTQVEIVAALPDKEQKSKVKNIIDSAKELLKNATAPIEKIIHDFSVEILKTFKSAFVVDQGKEIKRLRGEIEKALKEIEKTGREDAMEVLAVQMNKLKEIEEISTAAEGFVFDYNGYTYKFTGNFAPVNQILGMFKYGRGKIPALQNYLHEGGETIALFPGKFKPTHAGHLGVVLNVENKYKIDKFYVIISPKEHEGYDAETSKKIWDMYLETVNFVAKPNVEIMISDEPEWGGPSPVGAVYNYIDNVAEPNSRLILVLGQKDIDAEGGRYKAALDRREDLNIILEPIKLTGKLKDISATKVRACIEGKNKKKFINDLPIGLSDEKKEEIWNMVSCKKEETVSETLFNMIEKTIEEMSTAGGGASGGVGNIEGSPGAFSKKKKKKKKKRGNKKMRNEQIDRNEFVEGVIKEQKLRKLVRKAINVIQEKKENKQVEELKLRSFIKRLILLEQEEEQEGAPLPTSIKFLEKLLNNIVPAAIEPDFTSLTSNQAQRDSYRNNLITAILADLSVDIAISDIEKEVEKIKKAREKGQGVFSEAVDIKLDDEGIIDFESEDKRTAEEEEEKAREDEEKEFEKIESETPEWEKTMVTGSNRVGAMTAWEETMPKISKQIKKLYNTFNDEPVEQDLLVRYLLINVLLNLDELQKKMTGVSGQSIEEPNVPGYEREKQEIEDATTGAEEELPTPEFEEEVPEEEIELEL